MKIDTPILLGSSSPRRKEILSLFDFTFTIDAANIDESKISNDLTPKEYTETLARRKGEALLQKHPGCIIITADTIVYHEKKFLGKPKNLKQAFSMIKSLCGKTHLVGTSIAISYEGKVFSDFDACYVTFRDLNDHQIQKYIDAYHPLDKAGGYGAQDGAGILIQKIEGNFYNVVGFEIKLLEKLLSKIGINIWDHLKKSPGP